MSSIIVEIEPFPYESRNLLVAEDGTILAGEKLNLKRIDEGPSGLFAAHDLNTNLWGIFDEEGKEVLSFEYDNIRTSSRRFILTKGSETAYMDGDRNILSEEPEDLAKEMFEQLIEENPGFNREVYSAVPVFHVLKSSKEKLFKAFTTEGKLIHQWPYIAFHAEFLIQDDLLLTFDGGSRTLKEATVFDSSGEEIQQFQAIDGDESKLKFSSHFRVKQDDKWGYVDRRFQPVTDFAYHNATPMVFSRGFVQTEEEGPWKLINESGDVLRELEAGRAPKYYGSEKEVSEYYVWGLIPITGDDDQEGVIDRDGEVVVPLGSKWISPQAGYVAYNNADGIKGVITTDGTNVVPHQYESAVITPYDGDVYFRVKKDDRWGLLNEDGEEVLPMDYESLGYINELGQLRAQDKESKKFGVIDLEGNVVIPFEHDKLNEDRYGAANGFWVYEHGKFYHNLETGLTFQTPRDFRELSTSNQLLYAQFSTFGYSDIAIDKHGDFFEKIDFNYVPLAEEKSHTHALEQLVENLDAKAVKDLFSDVIYWHKSYWDVLEPHLESEHLPVVEALLKMASKKPYGADALAGGEEFFIEGLRIVGQFDADRVEPLAEELLKAGGRKKDRREKLAIALEKATSLSLQEPKKVIPLRHLKDVWAPVYTHLKKAHGDAADWSSLDEVLTGDLRAAVESGGPADTLKPFEKALDKVAKKEKTDDIKEIRDSVVVLRAWSERRSRFEDGWLNDPASEEKLTELQALYETPLPLSFLVSYRLYNGITSDEPVYMNGGDLLFSPVREILREYKSLQKFATNFVRDPERKETLREHVQTWLPVFNSNGNAWVLNMGEKLPGFGGRPILTGAIFDYNHEDGDLRELRVIYSSFKRLVEDLSGTTDL